MLKTAAGYVIPTGAEAVRAGETSLALCDYAAGRLRAAGFDCRYTSMRSEACYYGLPGKSGAIRIAAHRYGRTEARSSGLHVLACITFSDTYHPKTMDGVDTIIEMAVGRYFLANGQQQGTDTPPTLHPSNSAV